MTASLRDHPGNIYRQLDVHLAAMKQRYPRQFDCDSMGWAWPDGWNFLVDKMCRLVEEGGRDLRWHQIKEKFGGLRLYFHDQPMRIDWRFPDGVRTFYGGDWDRSLDAVLTALLELEQESMKTCCRCGSPGGRHVFDGWVLTVCPACTPIIDAYRSTPGRPPDP